MLRKTSLIFNFTLLVLGLVDCQTPPSNLPPAAPGVFTVQSSIIINAPIDDVWNALLDFPAYPEWNPFVRSQIVADPLFVPIADQTPHPESRLIIQAQIPPLPMPVNKDTPSNPANTQFSFENITALDPALHRAAWKQIYLPQGLLMAERWQALSMVDGKTYYEARENFVGVVGYVVDALFAQGLQEGFESQAEALKTRVEGN